MLINVCEGDKHVLSSEILLRKRFMLINVCERDKHVLSCEILLRKIACPDFQCYNSLNGIPLFD